MARIDTELTDLQAAILHTADENPDLSQSEIADRVGCSAAHVSKTLDQFPGEVTLSNDEENRAEGVLRSNSDDLPST